MKILARRVSVGILLSTCLLLMPLLFGVLVAFDPTHCELSLVPLYRSQFVLQLYGLLACLTQCIAVSFLVKKYTEGPGVRRSLWWYLGAFMCCGLWLSITFPLASSTYYLARSDFTACDGCMNDCRASNFRAVIYLWICYINTMVYSGLLVFFRKARQFTRTVLAAMLYVVKQWRCCCGCCSHRLTSGCCCAISLDYGDPHHLPSSAATSTLGNASSFFWLSNGSSTARREVSVRCDSWKNNINAGLSNWHSDDSEYVMSKVSA